MQRVYDLLGPRNTVKIARHRAKTVIRGNRAIGEILDLLQDRVGPAIGEDIAGQEKKRQTVYMRDRRSCHHVRGAGPDRARHCHHPAAEACLGKGDRCMRHRLFIMGAIGRQLIAQRIERLANSCNVAVTEDRPDTGYEWHFLPFDLGHLPREITGQCLRHG